MQTIIFDVDDTLYDQFIPFQLAFNYTFNYSLSHDELYHLFLASRDYSDQVFEAEQNGEISSLALQIFRITKACADLGLLIAEHEAIKFQQCYQHFQTKITLFPELYKALDWLMQQNVQIGILTNGNTEHQQMKIDQLLLQKWVQPAHTFISASIGHAKPSIELFRFIEGQMQLDRGQTWYVGDSFTNDVMGAKQAGWQSLWFNHRYRKQPKDMPAPNLVAHSPDELLKAIRSLSTSKKSV
ncbi:putative hydrolase of the HAD superfamily [Amphibacillus marinus]|uniref:Putative hydrolase of the HAD superfamily n=1 Tax=Amphibacillus marinus TaxID=872970 RepID=A0A1H8MCY8_9BACI|nr:HAD family hydrolase [Amphibacillus marinus]SEO15221.1 putative hydrolase of the HAD superfamily [Amphibacillus marinus]